jgi:hypothetical protein
VQSIPEMRCTTCGRLKALPEEKSIGLCTATCPGYSERPWLPSSPAR